MVNGSGNNHPTTVLQAGRMIATHGLRRNQGLWARVNNRVSLAYTEKKDGKEQVVSYTPVEDILPIVLNEPLPEFNVDF